MAENNRKHDLEESAMDAPKRDSTLPRFRRSGCGATSFFESPLSSIISKSSTLGRAGNRSSSSGDQKETDKSYSRFDSLLGRNLKRDGRKLPSQDIPDVRATTFDHHRQSPSPQRRNVSPPILKSRLINSSLSSGNTNLQPPQTSAAIEQKEKPTSDGGYQEFKALHSRIRDGRSLKNAKPLSSSLSTLNTSLPTTDFKSVPSKRFSTLLSSDTSIRDKSQERNIPLSFNRDYGQLFKKKISKLDISDSADSQIDSYKPLTTGKSEIGTERSKQNKYLQKYLSCSSGKKESPSLEREKLEQNVLNTRKESSAPKENFAPHRWQAKKEEDSPISPVRPLLNPSSSPMEFQNKSTLACDISTFKASTAEGDAKPSSKRMPLIGNALNSRPFSLDIKKDENSSIYIKEKRHLSPDKVDFTNNNSNTLSSNQNEQPLYTRSFSNEDYPATKREEFIDKDTISRPLLSRENFNAISSIKSSPVELSSKSNVFNKPNFDSFTSGVKTDAFSSTRSQENPGKPNFNINGHSSSQNSSFELKTEDHHEDSFTRENLWNQSEIKKSGSLPRDLNKQNISGLFLHADENKRATSTRSSEFTAERNIANQNKIDFLKEKDKTSFEEIPVDKKPNIPQTEKLFELNSNDLKTCVNNQNEKDLISKFVLVDKNNDKNLEILPIERRERKISFQRLADRPDVIIEENLSKENENDNDKNFEESRAIVVSGTTNKHIVPNDHDMMDFEDLLNYAQNSREMRATGTKMSFAKSEKSSMEAFAAEFQEEKKSAEFHFSKKENIMPGYTPGEDPDKSKSENRICVTKSNGSPQFSSSNNPDEFDSEINEKMNGLFSKERFKRGGNFCREGVETNSVFESGLNKQNRVYSETSSQRSAFRTEKMQKSIILNQKSSSTSTYTRRLQIGQRTVRRTSRFTRDSDEIVDEGPIQTKNNIGYEDGDVLEDLEDLLESGRFVESNNEEMPPKRQKVMDK